MVEKKGMLYIFKLISYANSGKNGTAVYIKSSTGKLLVETMGMFYTAQETALNDYIWM